MSEIGDTSDSRPRNDGSRVEAAACDGSTSKLAAACGVLLVCLLPIQAQALDRQRAFAESGVGLFGLGGPQSEWYGSLSGTSWHSHDTRAPGQSWNEENLGAGFERRVNGLPWDQGAARWQSWYSLNSLTDSRNQAGGYAGVSFMRELAHMGTFRVYGGVGTHLFYRSKTWAGQMALVPAVLPALSITERRTGLGVNFVIRPEFRGEQGAPSTILMQLTYRIAH